MASRLTEQYYRPAVVLTESEGVATGSARSVSGFDVYKAVADCSDLLENFGGHTYAAGLSLKVENVEAFTERFEAYVEKHILDEQTQASLDIDAVLDFKDINFGFYKQLRRFSPFGPDNAKPLFCTKHVYDYGTSKVVGRGQEHIKLELVDNKSNNIMNGIAFGQVAGRDTSKQNAPSTFATPSRRIVTNAATYNYKSKIFALVSRDKFCRNP